MRSSELTLSVPDIEWNMWSRREWPSTHLSEDDEVVYVTGGGPSAGRLMWTVRMSHLFLERYDSHDHAWKLMQSGLPAVHRSSQVTKKGFLRVPYTANAPDSGWLLAWVGIPALWLDRPRPPELRFRPNGWAELPDSAI
jgi:hypothetical protein